VSVVPIAGARSFERDVRRIGEEIFQRAAASSPAPLSQEYWQSSAMQWLTRHESLRLRLFRFIEVLPALRSSAAVARHMQDYLVLDEDDVESLPPLASFVLAFRRADSLHARIAARTAQWAGAIAARRFICGGTPNEAIAAVRRMRRDGMAFTLDVLGETVIADRVARDLQELYIRLIEELGASAPHWPASDLLDDAPWGRIPRVNVSVKLSGIVSSFDPIDPPGAADRVLERLRPLLRAARRHDVFVNVDMEYYAVKDLTLDIFKRVLSEPEFRDWPDCGIVIQCYTPEADADLAGLIDWARRRGTPITVRLVKGAYWDAETASALKNGRPSPLYAEKWQSDAAFERLANVMLRNADIIRPAFASHNVRSLATALAMESRLGLPPRTLEIQMLTGMGDQLKRALVQMRQRLRIYAPFGNQMSGMAYLIRRLIENTANESFLRQSFGDDAPVRYLLAAPRRDESLPRYPAPRPFIQDPDEYAEMHPFQNQSEVDFSRIEDRRAMHAAIDALRRAFPIRVSANIAGQPHDGAQWLEARNPANVGEVVGRVSMCDPGVVSRAVAAARDAAPDWAAADAEQRASMIDRAADRLVDRRFEAAAMLVFEIGKTWRDACGEVVEAIDYLRFYAYEHRRLAERPRRRDFPGETGEYAYRPRGIVAAIGPASFPLALLTGLSAAALVTGNAVIAKPPSCGAMSASMLDRVLHEAGVPSGVFQFMPGPGGSVGDALVRHRDVDMIAFTGSARVGRPIIDAARAIDATAASLKHVLAEMGGKNAIIVDDDADVDEAVQATIASAFGYCGQKCTSCARVIALPAVHDEFLEKLIEATRGIRPADPALPATGYGPMINQDAVCRARQWTDIGKLEGRCVFDGNAESSDARPDVGHYFLPVIFADVPPTARIAQDELLAPVLSVIRADDFPDAIRIANLSRYALTAGVFSRSPAHLELARRRLFVGTLYINRKTTVSRVDRHPFGGFRHSGLGTKSGGPDYLQQFTLPVTICENTMRHGFAPTATPSPRNVPEPRQRAGPSAARSRH
jgi:RHH-type proline utilization regulon transcriptional repressor/proline dehydrogenase/delta 1-pyrroline-5-carboxylate dehydrogenase